jgi:transcriptional regulator with XRE-family HTH domain
MWFGRKTPTSREAARSIIDRLLPLSLRYKWAEDPRTLLRDARSALGMTQQELAVDLGKAVVSVARWETSREPPLSVMHDLLDKAQKKGLFAIANRLERYASLIGGEYPWYLLPEDPKDLGLSQGINTDKDFEPLLKKLAEETWKNVPTEEVAEQAVRAILDNLHLPEVRKRWESLFPALSETMEWITQRKQAEGDVFGDPIVLTLIYGDLRRNCNEMRKVKESRKSVATSKQE